MYWNTSIVKKEQTRRTDERVSIEPTKPSVESHSGKINDEIRNQAEHELLYHNPSERYGENRTALAVRGEHAEEDSMVMAPPRHSVKKTGILVARIHKRETWRFPRHPLPKPSRLEHSNHQRIIFLHVARPSP